MLKQEQNASKASERLGESPAIAQQTLDARRNEAKVLIKRSDRVATELASVTARWQKACASGSAPGEICSLNTEIAALTERLKQLDAAALAAFQT